MRGPAVPAREGSGPASRGDAAPGTSARVCEPRPDGSCSICGDEGLVGEVLGIRADGVARVRLPDGAEREVATDLLDGVRRGERLVVHLGFAIARVRRDVREEEPRPRPREHGPGGPHEPTASGGPS